MIFLFTGFSLDAYAGIVFSFVVIKSGVDTLKNTASDLIGRSGFCSIFFERYNLEYAIHAIAIGSASTSVSRMNFPTSTPKIPQILTGQVSVVPGSV